jgi:hypothetical protein
MAIPAPILTVNHTANLPMGSYSIAACSLIDPLLWTIVDSSDSRYTTDTKYKVAWEEGMRRALLGMIASILVPTPPAEAQQGPSGQGNGPNNSGTRDFNQQQNFRDFYVGVADSDRSTMRAVPASPKDIVQGLEVHDEKGLLVGRIETVGKGFATVASAVGSVEVDFSSVAKNKNGLLINMPKSKIDALMTPAHPAP